MTAWPDIRYQISDIRILKLIILAFFLYTIYYILYTLPSPAFAQTPPGISFGEAKLDSSNFNYLINGEVNMMYTLPNGIISALSGISPLGQVPGIKLSADGSTSMFVYDRLPGGGAVGGITSIMTAMYSAPPIATSEYLAMVSEDFGFIKPAYAQVAGSGSGIIGPIAKLWEVVRNISYLLFIVIFLVVGLMIMFRQKLNPQTVLTVQGALPGLVIGLVLVTFSYFIAALLVDLSFVGVQLAAQIFISAKDDGGKILNAFGDETTIRNLASESNLFQLFTTSAFRGQNVTDVGQSVNNTLGSIGPIASGLPAALALVAVVAAIVLGVVTGPITLGIVGVAGLATGATGIFQINIVSLIIPLILIIALSIQFFRLAFKLLSSYISILVMTVLGPFIILLASVPGRGGALSIWWKMILANSLVFPAVFAGFLFAGMILGTDISSWATTPPLFGGLSVDFIRLIIAYGILLGLPAIPDMVKNALGVKDIQGIPQAALAGVGVGAGVVGSGVNQLVSRYQIQRQAYREAALRNKYQEVAGRGAAARRNVPWYVRFGVPED